jgi:hypothetical protein
MRKEWRVASISFEHMHMGDLLREAHELPNVSRLAERGIARFEIQALDAESASIPGPEIDEGRSGSRATSPDHRAGSGR